ncbi:Uncharacterised protein [Rodentibacter pneumotropicus]|uniref:Uncharacterized protein n=1 Tax=Rodentibacter pneumotropicus TaxID=758 RepID=A0A3S4TWK7_9PAST|nr:Uncharacterised protein [Rodentibacter pneumotropicus]
MQRYFQFKEEIILSKETSKSILVGHPAIMNNELAQSIKVEKLQINGYWEYENNLIKLNILNRVKPCFTLKHHGKIFIYSTQKIQCI